MQVQLGDKMALVREGQVVHVLATAGSTQVSRLCEGGAGLRVVSRRAGCAQGMSNLTQLCTCAT